MPIIFGEQEVIIQELSVGIGDFDGLGIGGSAQIDLSAGEYVRFGPGYIGAFLPEKAVAFVTAPSVTEITAELPVTGDPPFPPVWPYTWNTSLLYGREHLGQNIKMVRGDTFRFRVTITQNGETVDLTGGTFTMTAKWEVDDENVNAVFTKTSPAGGIALTDPTNGLITVTLSPSDTNPLPDNTVSLFYDIQYVNALGEIYTPLYGTLRIVPDITVA
jgi:hypothetical protein